jgi:hypothetical protein
LEKGFRVSAPRSDKTGKDLFRYPRVGYLIGLYGKGVAHSPREEATPRGLLQSSAPLGIVAAASLAMPGKALGGLGATEGRNDAGPNLKYLEKKTKYSLVALLPNSAQGCNCGQEQELRLSDRSLLSGCGVGAPQDRL